MTERSISLLPSYCGKEEARIGYVGVAHTIDLEDGILVDIGGGSTEVSVFRGRRLLRSVSFPFGAVNTTKQFAADGEFTSASLQSIRALVDQAIDGEPWIREHPQLPLVGLGGTIRSLSKISQRRCKYPLPLTHNYSMSGAHMDELADWITGANADARGKIDGLSKDRQDIIIPGLVILHAIFRAARSTHYVVSGAGLRDGLFAESVLPPGLPSLPMLERSARNLLALHPSAPQVHCERVSGMAAALFDALQQRHGLAPRCRGLLQAAALLYRIGVTVSYYQFSKHSFHLIAHSRLDGLSHRETLLCALAASFKSKKRTQQQAAPYKDILLDTDIELIAKLGSLLTLAVALDYSEAGVVRGLTATDDGKKLKLLLETQQAPVLEEREAEALRKDFKKIWGLPFTLQP